MSPSYNIHEHHPDDPDAERGGHRFRWIALGAAAVYWLWHRWRRGAGDDVGLRDVSIAAIRRGHVPADQISVGGITAFAVGLLVLIAAVLGGVAFLINVLERTSPVAASAIPADGIERAPTKWPLQVDPAVDLMGVRRREHQQLSSYDWVDRQRGIVSIPIEAAMDIIASRHDTIDADDRELLRLPTESGFTEVGVHVPPPSSPPFIGSSPERYAVSPDYARKLGLIDTNSTQSNVSPPK